MASRIAVGIDVCNHWLVDIIETGWRSAFAPRCDRTCPPSSTKGAQTKVRELVELNRAAQAAPGSSPNVL
eukprot:4131799-Pyramimonas_sp.AAC.1